VRLALVAPFVAPIDDRRPQIGGAQAVLADLATGLAARGHEVTVLAPRGSHVTGARVEDLGIDADPSEAVGVARGGDSQWRAFAAVGAWLSDRDFAVVHAHAFDAPAFAAVRGPRALHTLHLPPMDAEVVDAAGRADARLATVSASCRAAWAAAGVEVDHVLPNGIAVDSVPAGDGRGGGLAFVGRMSPEKGADAACRVARAVAIPLRLAGPIYDAGYFARAVQPLLGPDVAYLGELDRRAVARLMAESFATLMPVRWDEPFGLVALESLAAGTPVIAYARGGLPEVVVDRHSGRLVPPDDEPALAAAVHEARSLRRDDCRADARRFGLERMLDAHERLYATIAG